MSIHVLVLNYNGRALLEECLPSIWQACRQARVPCSLSVVDNASTDDSRDWLEKNMPEVGWIACPENLILFSYNAVVAGMDPEAVLLLNNDIKAGNAFIQPLWDRFKSEPGVFCVSPLHLDFSGAYNGGMNRFGSTLSLPWAGPEYRGALGESRQAGDTLFTGNGLFDREKFNTLGGFDPLFRPMGWEDTDLCTRAWRRGWPSLYEPASVVHHKSSASIARAFSASDRESLAFRNAFLWFFANFSSAGMVWRFWLLLPLTLPALLVTGRFSALRGFWSSLPRLAAARRRRRLDMPADRMSERELQARLGGRH